MNGKTSQDPIYNLIKKYHSILTKGFYEPIILLYNFYSSTATVVEGNTRLMFSYLNNIKYMMTCYRQIRTQHGRVDYIFLPMKYLSRKKRNE